MDYIEHELQVEREDQIPKNVEVNQGEGGPSEGPQGQIEEELGKDLKIVAPPKFDGKSIGVGANAWIIEMDKYFGLCNLSDQTKVAWATYQLLGEVATWWDHENIERNLQSSDITWKIFLQYFRKRCLP